MNHDEQDLQRRFDALRERERRVTPDFEHLWRRARQTPDVSPSWRWRPAFALATIATALVCTILLWWQPVMDAPRVDGAGPEGVPAAASVAASDWQMPSDQLLDEPADLLSLRIAGLVREINSLLQP